jgi:hypothetical protein
MHKKFRSGNLKEEQRLLDLGVDTKLVLIFVLSKQSSRVWVRYIFMSLWKWWSGGLVWIGIPWKAKSSWRVQQLPSSHELSRRRDLCLLCSSWQYSSWVAVGYIYIYIIYAYGGASWSVSTQEVRTFAGTPAILTEVYRSFTQSLQAVIFTDNT